MKVTHQRLVFDAIIAWVTRTRRLAALCLLAALPYACAEQSAPPAVVAEAAGNSSAVSQTFDVAVADKGQHDHASHAPTSGVAAIAGIGVEKYIAGQHYEVLPDPADTLDASKIEVMEVFWYGCSHCYDFEPLIKAWKKTIADDVVFARTPAMWDGAGIMRHHGTVYYTAEALGVLEAVHGELFELLADNRQLVDQEAFAKVFARHGIAREDYLSTFAAFGTKGKVSKAEKRARQHYRIQGTPEIIVNGKYRISAREAGGQAGMLAVVDFLIKKERLQE